MVQMIRTGKIVGHFCETNSWADVGVHKPVMTPRQPMVAPRQPMMAPKQPMVAPVGLVQIRKSAGEEILTTFC